MEPAGTRSPGPTWTGSASPVIRDWSTSALPVRTTPSTGTRPPGLRAMTCPGRTSSRGTSVTPGDCEASAASADSADSVVSGAPTTRAVCGRKDMRSVRASRPRSIDSSSRTSAHSAKTVTARAVTHSPMTAAATMARSIDSSMLMRRSRRSSAASTRSGQQPTASTTAPTAPTAQPGAPVVPAIQAPSAATPTTAMRTTSAHSIRSRIRSPVRAPEGVPVLENSSESSTGSAGVEADGAEAGGDTWAVGGWAVIQGLLTGGREVLPGRARERHPGIYRPFTGLNSV